MSRTLTFEATLKQEEALQYLYDDVTESIGYGGGGGGGKSFCGVFWVWSMCQSYPGVRYFFAREQLKNLKRTTLVSYFEFLDKYDIPDKQRGHFSDPKSSITFSNGSEIFLVDLNYKPSDRLGRRFGSLLFTGGFIDESYECDPNYIDVLYSRIGRWKNAEYKIKPKILETFNPDKGHVYNRFYIPWKKKELPDDRKFIPALVIDRLKKPDFFRKFLRLHTLDIGTEAGIYVETLMKRGKVVRERLLWGNFEYDDNPDRLLTYDAIQDLFSNTFVKPSYDIKERCITADIAMRGSDLFVIGVWYGKVLIAVYEYEKSGGKTIVDELKRIAELHEVPHSHIIYDGDGLGAFIGEEGGFIPDSKSFNNGSRPSTVKKENYTNLKAFCAHYFAAVANRREYYLYAISNDDVKKDRVRRELEQLVGTESGDDLRTQGIISKEEMRQNLGFSPDYMDMMIMREYLPYSIKKWTGDGDYA